MDTHSHMHSVQQILIVDTIWRISFDVLSAGACYDRADQK